MKKTVLFSTLSLCALLASGAHAANYNRAVSIYSGDIKTMSLKIQFSGACKGSATITNGLQLRFGQLFDTDSSGNVLSNTMIQQFTIFNYNISGSFDSGDNTLLTTGDFTQYSNNISLKPLLDTSENISEKVAKGVATVTYTNKNPDVLIRQFNYYLDMLEPGGKITKLGNIDLSKCIAAYRPYPIGYNIRDVAEVNYFRGGTQSNSPTYYDKYIVDSAKKTNIVGKFSFSKNENAPLLGYSKPKSVDVKATMSGVLISGVQQCSGKVGWPTQSSCKPVAPLKYKVSFVAKGDITL